MLQAPQQEGLAWSSGWGGPARHTAHSARSHFIQGTSPSSDLGGQRGRH